MSVSRFVGELSCLLSLRRLGLSLKSRLLLGSSSTRVLAATLITPVDAQHSSMVTIWVNKSYKTRQRYPSNATAP